MEARREREFTSFERYYFWRNKLNMYSNFRVAVEYTEELEIQAIYNALYSMIKKHASLSMNAYKKQQAWPFEFPYYLKFMDVYKLSDVLEIIEDNKIKLTNVFDKLESVHFKYGTNKPLWSLILLNKRTLVYYSDHLLFDGSSGLNFHRKFSEELRVKNKYGLERYTGMDSVLFDRNKMDHKFKLTPKPSDLIDYSVPILYIVYIIILLCCPLFLVKFIKCNFIDDDNTVGSRTYSMITLSTKMIELNDPKDQCKLVHIPQNRLQQLIKSCRKHDVKLTSLLVVMSLLSISKITGNEKDTITIIPVNARSKIPNEGRSNFHDFGLYLGDINIELPPVNKMCINGQINWNFVKYVNNYIHLNIKNSQRDLGLIKLIDSKMFLERRKMCCENSIIGTLLVSNLGNLEELEGGRVFEKAYFDQPCKSGVLSLFAMNVVSTARGGAHLSLHAVNRQWLEIFNEGICHQLSKFP